MIQRQTFVLVHMEANDAVPGKIWSGSERTQCRDLRGAGSEDNANVANADVAGLPSLLSNGGSRGQRCSLSSSLTIGVNFDLQSSGSKKANLLCLRSH